MNQRTHTWLAIRAMALLADEGAVPELLALLQPHVLSTAIGAWIPDLRDTKAGSGDLDNHIFKLAPYDGPGKQRFVQSRTKLFDKLGTGRSTRGFIQKYGGRLGAGWWSGSYKADPQPGQHLANRSMALTTTLIDQLILGDPEVARRVPGTVHFAHRLDPQARSRPEEVATYFFMLSHFVADSCQPCHCDARRLSGYSNGLHKELEAHWSKRVGTYFDKAKLFESHDGPDEILRRAREIDAKFDVQFDGTVPALRARDTWEEVVILCRASFAVASILVPPSNIPYDSDAFTSDEEVFAGTAGETLLADLDRAVMHDAVLNIAIVWKEVWNTFD